MDVNVKKPVINDKLSSNVILHQLRLAKNIKEQKQK